MMHAVILAGGWGRRFWPKSRRNLPKQLLDFNSGLLPIQDLLKTLKAQIPKERIWLVTNKNYAAHLARKLPGLPKKNLLVEPLARNSAAAIGLAAVAIKQLDPQAVILVLASDHIIGEKARFWQAAKAACRLAQSKDGLVTIGIPPQRAAVEFGYLKIRPSEKIKIKRSQAYKVEKFIEKPSLKQAQGFLKSKNYLWNSGMFAWKAGNILEAIKTYLPGLYSGLEDIEAGLNNSSYSNRLARVYKRLKEISVEYGVMEKADNVYAVVGGFIWQELGSWSSLSGNLFAQDKDGNIIWGRHKGIDTANSVILAEKDHLVGTIGVRDLIIVHTASATLVCKKDQTQDVKKLTQMLEKDKQLCRYL
jgi:mannose-1-phosphate guanylyltransferase